MWQKYAERANVLPLTPYYKERNQNKGFSKKKKFNLAGDADLSQNKSPMVNGKAFSITVNIAKPGTEGVLVAQGGDAAGYSLYLKDGKLHFAVRRGGNMTSVAGDFPTGTKKLTVDLAADGSVQVTSNGESLFSGDVGLLNTMPIDGLQVGKDLAGNVGDYEGDFEFDGSIERVEVAISK